MVLVVVEELAATFEQLASRARRSRGCLSRCREPFPVEPLASGIVAVPAGLSPLRNRRRRSGASSVPSGSSGFRPRSGTAPVYVEIEIEVVCHVRWATPVSPAPGSRLRLDSDSKDTGRRGLLRPTRSSRARPGGSGESSIGPVAEFRVQAGPFSVALRRMADLETLMRGAEEALPEGQLEKQLAKGTPLRVKLGIDPSTRRHPPRPCGGPHEARPVPAGGPHRGADHRRLHGAGRRPERARHDAAGADSRARSRRTRRPTRTRPSRSSTASARRSGTTASGWTCRPRSSSRCSGR